MNKDKYLDKVGLAHLWKRITDYVQGVVPKKMSELKNDMGYTSNGVTSFNGSTGAVVYNGVDTVNGKRGNVQLTIPTKTSELENDSRFITEGGTIDAYTKSQTDTLLSGKQDTINDLSSIRSGAALGTTALQSYTETDPTVPSWAKASTKPSYSISEISGGVTVTANPTLGSDPPSLTSIAIGDTSYAIEGGGGESTIEVIEVNGTALEIDNKTVNIDLSDYALSTDIPDVSGFYTLPSGGIPASDLASGVIPDVSNFISTSQTAGLVKNDGTIDTNTYLTSAHEVPSGGNSGQVLKKSSATDYDYAWANQTQDYPSAYCKTAAGTAGKTAACTFWTATANTYLHIVIVYANTSASALTLNVNSTSAAPLYINGVVSSSTNYTLPAGSYIAFYDGTNWYINTDGTIPKVLHKSSTSGLVKNDGTIDTSTYLTSHQDISGKADKVSNATNGHLAGLDANGNLTDSGFKIVTITESAYEDLATKDAYTLYLITES